MAQKATITAIARFLNRTLRVRSIKDASVNGLQVRSRKAGEIRMVGFAVDGCLSTFEKAKELGVELLVVHHGIAWRPQKDRDLEKGRAAWLRKNNMALYAVHLPLDLHEEYGNNMQLCRLLGVQDPKKFGRYHGIKIGYAGTFKRAVSLNAAASVLNRGSGHPMPRSSLREQTAQLDRDHLRRRRKPVKRSLLSQARLLSGGRDRSGGVQRGAGIRHEPHCGRPLCDRDRRGEGPAAAGQGVFWREHGICAG